MSLQARVESAITDASGEPAHFADSRTCHGGSINDSALVTLRDGRQVFLKTHRAAASLPGMFALEYEALHLLSDARVIRVPRPIACDEDFIVMEAFTEGRRRPEWAQCIGGQLAQLHQATRASRFGFARDNYIGTSVQPNTWSDNWLEFWRSQRLGHQLQMFSASTGGDDPLLALGRRLLDRLDDLLADIDEPAVLLHGDLWSGNAAADADGEPVIFDPASYYGHREAELGMMRMFGGFGPVCEAAYSEVWPLAADADRRISLYRLYHELNHLNLFGRSYYAACLATIKGLL